MSHPRAQRLLSSLALAAMVLLATLPTLGRMALTDHLPLHAMTMASHEMQASHDPMPAPVPRHHGEDCDYCVLLSGAVPTPAWFPVVAAALPARWVPPSHGSVAVAGHGGPGLGARGPPPGA